MSRSHLTELWHCFMFLLVLFSAIHIVSGLFFSKKLSRCIFLWRYGSIYLVIFYTEVLLDRLQFDLLFHTSIYS